MIVTEKNKQLLDLFFKIKQVNPNAILTGSLALNLQNIKTRNEPSDLDIYIPYNEKINVLDGFIEQDSMEYPEEDYELIQYKLNDIKIDFFQPNNNILISTTFTDYRNENNERLKVVSGPTILRYKFEHVFSLVSSYDVVKKQADDLGFIFGNMFPDDNKIEISEHCVLGIMT
jgi:hypothetical protein